MSDDWQVGDRAVCIKGEEICGCGCGQVVPGPRTGQVLIVDGVRVYENTLELLFTSFPPTNDGYHVDEPWYWARDFRKIRPDITEPCEEEFVTLLNRKRVSA